jgi:hypothetical protein
VVLALAIAALAIAAAPASAATSEMGTISQVSYAAAHVTGTITSDSGPTAYAFQYSTDGNNWNTGASGTLGEGPFSNLLVKADFSGLKGGTQYFVRLAASSGFFVPDPPEAVSPGPNPEFTTLPVAPPENVSIDAPAENFSIAAKLSGKVKRPSNPDPSFDVKCRFEYVSDEQFQSTGFDGATKVPCEPNPLTEAGVEKVVTAKISGLTAVTTYHQRLVAENGAPQVITTAPSTFTTAPTVAKPKVLSVNDATDVSYRTATLSGEIERPAGADPALDTNCRFEAVTDEQFKATGFDAATSYVCDQQTLKTPGPTVVTSTSQVPRLKSGVTYHYRLTAVNAAGTDTKTTASTFTTLAGGEPTLATDPNPVVGYTTVELFGTVDRGLGADDEYMGFGFQIAEVGTENWSGYEPRLQPLPKGPGLHNVSVEHTGLRGEARPNPGTEYKYRLVNFRNVGADNWVEEYSPEPYPTFTTRPLANPTATLDPVTILTGTTAHFSAIVDTNAPAGPLDALGKTAYRTDWHIECTPECPPNADLSGVVEGEEGSKAISVDAIRLEPNKSYEVKLIAHNEVYNVETPMRTFQTLLIKPTIKSSPGGSDGNGGYILEGVVNPNNSLVTGCKFEWGPSLPYAFSAPCQPTPGDKAKPITVEAHLTGLTPDAVYHAKLIATNGGGSADSGDFTFIPTLDAKDPCPNDRERKENNSLALPECRAYEQVSDPNKEGADAVLHAFAGDDTVGYRSDAGNIANSGQGGLGSNYTTVRSSTGWETIANLNGPTGSQYTGEVAPEGSGFLKAYSADLRSSLWHSMPKGAKAVFPDGTRETVVFLRKPDGSFVRVGDTVTGFIDSNIPLTSDDLSHIVYDGASFTGYTFGPGVYEFVGTGNGLPERIDIDNSGDPVSACQGFNPGGGNVTPAFSKWISNDGRVILFAVAGGCGGASPPVPNPPANEVWARIGDTASVRVSASQCTRVDCNAPADANFEAAAKDGSRVFFTTTQQLLNGDIDQTKDLYACDIPSGPLTPTGTANSCSALRQVSVGYPAGAEVERVLGASKDGSTVYFVAGGVLAGNEDTFGNKAKFGDPNLYVWRTDAAHPEGQTTFVTRIVSTSVAQITPDGHYAVLSGTDRLTLTDNDDSKDLFRYDAEAGEIVRVSTNVSGTGGNGAFDATSGGISDDGQKIAFTTEEALAPVDGNEEADAYLWSASTGRVYLISSGSVGGGADVGSISPSGKSVYFTTRQVLTPSDLDNAQDVYTARIGGGFSFAAQTETCSGEACQPPVAGPPAVPAPAAPNPQGNVKLKLCPKGKVAKGEKCVKKARNKHSKKKAKGQSKRANHNRGGSK